MHKAPLLVAGFIFLLVAIGHFVRLWLHLQLVAAGYFVPMTVSYIGFAVTILLAIWMFYSAFRK